MTIDPDETPQTPDIQREMGHLVFLRRLVTVLTAVMIGGLLVLISLIVIRFNATSAVKTADTAGFSAESLPDHVTLPDGARATGYAAGGDWFAVVTDLNQIVIFDAETGAQRQIITLD